MSAVTLGVIVPLFGVMLAGWLAGRCGLLPPASSNVLSRFVFLVAMPAMIFVSLARVPVSDFFNWPFLGALGGGMLAMYCLGLAVARYYFYTGPTALGLHALTVMFSSTAYIGLPIILIVYGDAGLVPGVIGAVITVALFMPLSIVAAELDRGQGGAAALVASLLAVLRNPLLLATAAGLGVSAAGWTLPAPLAGFCELLGGAFVPCALFAAGLFVAGRPLAGAGNTAHAEIAWLIGAKLLVHPLLTALLAWQVFELDPVLAEIALLQAALPAGVPVFVLAQRYGRFVPEASVAIALSTALSLFTLSALLLWLDAW